MRHEIEELVPKPRRCRKTWGRKKRLTRLTKSCPDAECRLNIKPCSNVGYSRLGP